MGWVLVYLAWQVRLAGLHKAACRAVRSEEAGTARAAAAALRKARGIQAQACRCPNPKPNSTPPAARECAGPPEGSQPSQRRRAQPARATHQKKRPWCWRTVLEAAEPCGPSQQAAAGLRHKNDTPTQPPAHQLGREDAGQREDQQLQGQQSVGLGGGQLGAAARLRRLAAGGSARAPAPWSARPLPSSCGRVFAGRALGAAAPGAVARLHASARTSFDHDLWLAVCSMHLTMRCEPCPCPSLSPRLPPAHADLAAFVPSSPTFYM